MSTPIATSDVSFDAFARARYDGLVRLAALLAGDEAAAGEIAARALGRVGATWGRALAEDPDAIALQAVVAEVLRGRRGAIWGRARTGRSDPVPGLAHLRPGPRAVAVLRHYLGLTPTEVAEAMGCREATVRRLDRRGRGLDTLSSADLARAAAAVRPPPARDSPWWPRVAQAQRARAWRVAVALVVGAVAIGVPVLLLARVDTRLPGPPPPQPPYGRLDLDRLPLGDPAEVAVVVGSELRLPGRGAVRLEGAYTQLGEYAGGYLGVRRSGATWVVDTIRADGRVLASAPSGPRFGADGRGRVVVVREDRLVLGEVASGRERVLLDAGAAGLGPVGWAVLSGEEQVVLNAPAGQGLLLRGSALEVVPGVARWVAGDPGRVTVRTTEGCSELRSAAGGTLASSCLMAYDLFNPGVRRDLVAVLALGERDGTRRRIGLGDGQEGDLFGMWSTAEGAIVDAWGWESQGSLLASIRDPSGWTLVRLGPDGSAERIAGPEEAAYTFLTPTTLPDR